MMSDKEIIDRTRKQLVETGGRTSQDLGAGRIVGQVLVFLYLQEKECSLDEIGEELGLSKASVSIAARQLEKLALVRKVWKKGDRKNYYRSADNIGSAVQAGILSMVRNKVQIFGEQLEIVAENLTLLQSQDKELIHEAAFLSRRVSRAKKLQKRLQRVLNNPLVNILTGQKRHELSKKK